MQIAKVANNQRLLFHLSKTIKFAPNTNYEIPKSFYEDGYALMQNITTPDKAHAYIEKFLSSLDHHTSELLDRFLPRTKLAKVDRIPVCKPVVECTFQALHLDMGQPLLNILPQTIFNCTALYFPMDQKGSSAKTRIVPLKQLLHQKKWGDYQSVKNRLLHYIEQYGDGWDNVNTGRLACCARIIDAMTEQEELIRFRDQHTNEWFEQSNDTTGMLSRNAEKIFFQKHGYDIDVVEKQIQLQPGQLLIIDNLQAVHGKIGKRDEAEIYQFMYGIEEVTSEDIDCYRNYLVEQLANS